MLSNQKILKGIYTVYRLKNQKSISNILFLNYNLFNKNLYPFDKICNFLVAKS